MAGRTLHRDYVSDVHWTLNLNPALEQKLNPGCIRTSTVHIP